jgi:cell division protein FtsA
MAKERVITAIDLGTEKCVTLIATLDEIKQLNVVGVSVVPSKGMRRSMIIDLEQVIHTINQSLDGAERMAGFDVSSAYLSVSGAHIKSKNSKGVVAVASPNQEIIHEDVTRVIEAARAISLPGDRQVMHVIPRYFKVDSQEGIRDPVGMTGVRLESEAHIITGMTTSLRNLEKCVNDLGLIVDGFVFSSLAAGEVVLSETEKELGVVVLDIGAGSTSYCVYVEGSIEFSGAIPVGARHITQDIALGCRISLDSAEKIKLSLTDDDLRILKPRAGESKEDLNKRRKNTDKLYLDKVGVHDGEECISKKTLIQGIMIPRIKEIMEMVSGELSKNELLTQIPAGLVLCGGGAHTAGIVEVAKKVLRLPARIARPEELKGLTGDLEKAAFATSVGLLVYGKQHGGGSNVKHSFDFNFLKKFNLGKFTSKLPKLFKQFLP